MALHDLVDTHRNRPPRNVLVRQEPALVELLTPAGLVECNDNIRIFDVEIGGRVIEGKMAVLANSYECDVDRMVPQCVAQTTAFGPFVAFSIDPVKCLHRHRQAACKPLPQKAAKRRWMRERHANVLVEMETSDEVPRNVRLRCERGKHFDLGSACRNDNVGASLLLHRSPNETRAVSACGVCHLRL